MVCLKVEGQLLVSKVKGSLESEDGEREKLRNEDCGKERKG